MIVHQTLRDYELHYVSDSARYELYDSSTLSVTYNAVALPSVELIGAVPNNGLVLASTPMVMLSRAVDSCVKRSVMATAMATFLVTGLVLDPSSDTFLPHIYSLASAMVYKDKAEKSTAGSTGNLCRALQEFAYAFEGRMHLLGTASFWQRSEDASLVHVYNPATHEHAFYAARDLKPGDTLSVSPRIYLRNAKGELNGVVPELS